MKILFAGFDPFGGEHINPAFEAIRRLPDSIAGAEVIKVEIPTVFGKGAEVALEAVRQHRPDYVIAVGQAGGRAAVTPEFVGINYCDARIPDNEQNRPLGQSIVEGGENAYFTRLPVKAMVEKLRSAGIPAAVSYTAGTYVCNDVMYRLLHYIHTEQPELVGGFIHVPYAAEQAVSMAASTPSMPLAMISDALRLAAEAAMENEEDISVAHGETH